MKRIELIIVLGFLVIRLSLVIGAILAIIAGKWMSLGLAIFVLAMTFLPGACKRMLRIPISGEFSLALILFIYAGTFLGDTVGLYDRFWWWDIMLHSVSGPILGNLGFLIINRFECRTGEGQRMKALFSFCFAVALGAAWEIYEFSMDQLLNFSMQENSLDDTMWDIILNVLGALIFADWKLRRKRTWPRTM